MPGGPIGRACDACRTAKKKCDYGRPECSRCKRLGFVCTGSGQQRFAFRGAKCPRRQPVASDFNLSMICAPPGNSTQTLLAAYLHTIRPDIEPRFSLSYTYGRFLDSLPQRIGSSQALDAATHALVLAHRDTCTGSRDDARTIDAYYKAINKLRMALDDPHEAANIHSVAAATVLVICRDLNGLSIMEWSAHTLGAVDILSACGHTTAQDEFEVHLLQYLQGSLVGHCVFFRSSRADPDRFERLVETLVDDMLPDNIMHHICGLPRILQRGRTVRIGSRATFHLFRELDAAYTSLSATRQALASSLEATTVQDDHLQHQLTTGYGFVLCLCCIYHCMLNGPVFQTSYRPADARQLVQAVLALAQRGSTLLPLGSAFLFLPLSTALLHREDESSTRDVEHAYLELLQKFYGQTPDLSMVRLLMAQLRCDLHFETLATP